jgi:hypothetical protein
MNNFTDEKQDVAGVYLNCTKNTTIRMGNPVYDDATLFEFYYLKPFKQA